MTEHIEKGAIKVIELMGVSPEGFEDAVRQAVTKAAVSVDKITGVEILKFSACVNEGRISEYHANLKLAFVVK